MGWPPLHSPSVVSINIIPRLASIHDKTINPQIFMQKEIILLEKTVANKKNMAD